MKKKSWQRMALSLAGVLILAGMWRWSVYHLYTLPEHSIAAFVSLTTNDSYVIGAIVIFMVTGRLVYEWKHSTTAETIIHSVAAKVRPRDLDDGSVD